MFPEKGTRRKKSQSNNSDHMSVVQAGGWEPMGRSGVGAGSRLGLAAGLKDLSNLI